MPLYEYKCDRCNEVFEVMQKFSDEPLTVHASCGGAVERLISAPAFQFKGSGWYVNDYGRKGKSGDSSSKSNGNSSTKTETQSDSKSESKSETKTESKSESKPAESKPAPTK
jgi:putative FmdB family regulatory protein